MPLDPETALSTADLARRLANVVRPGAVAEADYERALVRVQFGGATTNWLPWLTRRAGADVDWWAPEVGEQVLILAPSGEPENGWVLPAGYSNAAPAPETTPDVERRTYKDGTVDKYDRSANKRTLDLSDSTGTVEVTNGKVTITVADGNVSVELDGDVTVNAGGNAEVNTGGETAVTAGSQATVDAPLIAMNKGTGVVTGESICHFTGNPHGDISGTVTAGK